MSFTFTPPASRKAASFLERAAAHLETLTPAAREAWFKEWIPAMRQAPLSGEVGAACKSLVIVTLERWREQARSMGEHAAVLGVIFFTVIAAGL
jgi:hypothetical protein